MTTGPTYTDVDIDPYEDPLSQPHDCTITPPVVMVVVALILVLGFLSWAAI